ncbi:hypothetical protein THOM_1394, partial [Trachipleistophora hominis]
VHLIVMSIGTVFIPMRNSMKSGTRYIKCTARSSVGCLSGNGAKGFCPVIGSLKFANFSMRGEQFRVMYDKMRW